MVGKNGVRSHEEVGMANAEESRVVQLLIKNPYNPNIDTLEIPFEVNKNSTVADIKALLHGQYPSNPLPMAQRLIYFGKILEEKQSCFDVFAKADLNESVTLHLLIPVEREPPVPVFRALSFRENAGHQEENEDDFETYRQEEQQHDYYGQQGFNVATFAGLATGAHAGTQAAYTTDQLAQDFPDQTRPSPPLMAHENAAAQQVADAYNIRAGLDAGMFAQGFMGPAALAFLHEENGDIEDDDESAASRIRTPLRIQGIQARMGIPSTRQQEQFFSLPDKYNQEEDVNEEPEPKDFKECIAQLKYHHDKLIQAIEASQQLQAAAMQMQMNFSSLNPHHQQMWAPQQDPRTDEDAAEINQQEQQANGRDNQGENYHVQQQEQRREQNVNGANRLQQRVIIINVKLMLKLGLLIYLLADESSMTQVYTLAMSAVLFYCYEMGYLVPILGTREQQMDFLRRQRLHELGFIATREQVPPGVVADAWYFIKAFVLSIIPSWQVEARQEPEVPGGNDGFVAAGAAAAPAHA